MLRCCICPSQIRPSPCCLRTIWCCANRIRLVRRRHRPVVSERERDRRNEEIEMEQRKTKRVTTTKCEKKKKDAM